jgi:hypothetical protein
MPPLDALTAKQHAYESLHTDRWSWFATGYIRSVTGTLPSAVTFGRPAPAWEPVHRTTESLTADLVRCLNFAECFYVSPEMNVLVTAAAGSWPADEALRYDDIPAADGWLWIPDMLPIAGVHEQGSGGITTIDIRGQLMSTSAISWHVAGGLMTVYYWADKNHDRPDVKAQPGWPLMPRFTIWHEAAQQLDQPLVQALRLGTVLPPEISEQIDWQMTDTDEGRRLAGYIPHEGWSPEQLRPRVGVDQVMAWLVSALRIMRQPLASIRRQGLPANVRRGLERRPRHVKNKAVTVIEFRRRSVQHDQLRSFEFSHRFLRRGHWRKQWYGSHSAGDRHQEVIWIHDAIVGDPSKPFILRKHVNALIR